MNQRELCLLVVVGGLAVVVPVGGVLVADPKNSIAQFTNLARQTFNAFSNVFLK